MQHYARHRARIEEEIMRKAEARQLGCPSQRLAAAGHRNAVAAGVSGHRALLHMDSQHVVRPRVDNEVRYSIVVFGLTCPDMTSDVLADHVIMQDGSTK